MTETTLGCHTQPRRVQLLRAFHARARNLNHQSNLLQRPPCTASGAENDNNVEVVR